MRILAVTFASLMLLIPSCKTRSSQESTPDAASVSQSDQKIVEDALSKVKATSISPDPEPSLTEQGLGLTWVQGFSDFFNSKVFKNEIDTPILPEASLLKKTEQFYYKADPVNQKALWNKVLDDWKNGTAKFNPEKDGNLIPSYDMFKSALSARKDYKIIGDLSKIKDVSGFKKDGLLIKGPDGKYAVIRRKKNGEMQIRQVTDFNPKVNRIVIRGDDAYSVKGAGGSTEMVDIASKNEDFYSSFEKVTALLTAKKFEDSVNLFLKHLVDKKRVDLNGFIDTIEKTKYNFAKNEAGKKLFPCWMIIPGRSI